MLPKHVRLTATALFALLLAACGRDAVTDVQPRPVRVQMVAYSDFAERDLYSGEVRARYEADFGFRIGGKLIERLVDVGTQVKKDQVLARLDPQDVNLQADAAAAQVSAAQTDHDWAKAELDRHTSLLDKGLIGMSVYDQRLAAFRSAEARLEQARAQNEVSRNQAQYAELRADADGVVTAVRAESGQVVSAGQPVVRIARPDEKDVVINVPEARIDKIAVGDPVVISLWADRDQLFKGQVRELAPGADPTTRTYTAKVAFEAAPDSVQLGMTANVGVARGSKAAVALLPLTALTQIEGAPAVWVVDTELNTVSIKPVRIGEYREDGVTVIDGVSQGELVVTAGVHKLLPGQSVRLLEDA